MSPALHYSFKSTCTLIFIFAVTGTGALATAKEKWDVALKAEIS